MSALNFIDIRVGQHFNMKRLMILGAVWALASARPELYKEKEDFQFSRSSSDDGTKSGFYGAQRGNMGGNYERAHNMDALAQHQMSGLVKQVEGELGDGANMRTGSVYTAANSRGTYGSGHFDLSNLAGRNFQESVSSSDSQSQSSHSAHSASSAYNAAYANSGYQGSRHNGYQATGYSGHHLQSDDLQTLTDQSQRTGHYDYGRQTSQASGYNAQSGYQQLAAYDTSNTNSQSGGYGSNVQTRLISATPVRVIVRPGTRVVIPVAAQTYDQNALNTDAEVLSNDNQRTVYRVPTNARHYESAYNYRKEWEKHDTIPANVVLPTTTDNPFPRNSELYEDGEVLAGTAQHDTRRVDSQRAHSTYGGYNAVKSTSGQSRYNYDTQRNAASHTNANAYSVAGYGTNNHETSSDSSFNGYNSQQSQYNAGRYHGASAGALSQAAHNAATDLNSQFENVNGQPKSYQSAYSYHKSWERQGDPYVIKPASGAYYDGQSSQRLSTGLTQNQGYSSTGSHYQHSHASGADCDENGHIRVARSYNTDQFQDTQQQSQNLEDLGQQQSQNLEDFGQQQSQNLEDFGQQQSQNLEDFGQQQSQNLEDFGQQQSQNLEDFGQQQSQNLEDFGQQPSQKIENFGQEQQSQNLEDLGQQQQSQNLEDFGQQQQSQNLEDFGQQQQSQNLEDFGQQQQSQNFDYFSQQQQNQNLADLGQQQQQNLEELGQQLENLGQQTQVQWEPQQEAGQQTQNTWDNLENLSQQTHNKWDDMQHTWDKFDALEQKPQENQNGLQQRPQDIATELKNNTEDQQAQDKWSFNFESQDEQQTATAHEQENAQSNIFNQQETQAQHNDDIFSDLQQSQKHNNGQLSVWDKFDFGLDQQQHKDNNEHANSNGNPVNWSFVPQQIGQQPLNSGSNPESQSVYHNVNDGSTTGQITSTIQSDKTAVTNEQSNTASFDFHDGHFNTQTNQNQFWNEENSYQETHHHQSNHWFFSNGSRQEQTTNTDSSSHAFDTISTNTAPLSSLWDKLGDFEQTLPSSNANKDEENTFSQVHSNTQNSYANSMNTYHNIESISQEHLNSQMKPIQPTTEKDTSQNKLNETGKESSLDVGRGDIGPEDASDFKPEKYPTDIPESLETIQNQNENSINHPNLTNTQNNNQNVQHHGYTHGQHYFHQHHDFQEQNDAENTEQQNLHVLSLHETIVQPKEQISTNEHNVEQHNVQDNLEQQNLQDFGQQVNLEQQNLQDFGQQENLEQQNLQDFGQQENVEQQNLQDFGQQENLEQQNLQDFGQQENLEQQNLQDFGQQENLEQQNLQDFGQQENLEQQNLQEFGQQENLEQQNLQDFGQQENLEQQNLQDFGQQENLEQQNLQDFGQQTYLEQHNLQSFGSQGDMQYQNKNLEQLSQNPEQPKEERTALPKNIEQSQTYLPPVEEIEQPIVKKQSNDLHSISSPTQTSIERATEAPGFWKSIGNKFSRAKSKIASWF
ncbi:hypothetical protein PYW08_003232 [Mythimna loreyi]|uniref:Uncharacterized protein n=1 Tax=Mythimna loreyi TaxID=667449 RepID=A0ACC2QQR4_9NEOP|nr:hypothetical protein PYW08_003232 [Mythimna loreyi]